ncbi:peptidase inhibitor family I36 protein [Yersinia ruckeri]|uniref:peptidase inhibitor family I36 protein n=1 Tax=Yersinia ruckeri TaxID=29486 RepID=UPI0005ABD499|nr:peptidase inhibitor family I36 protein [Yersinia ruckeri]MCW6568503.1 peptidase inhibitor family I36 protein [Yersinia ruckeri]
MRFKKNIYLFFVINAFCFELLADEPAVCFFMDDNYHGESICATQGKYNSDIDYRWNDRISSISVPHGMEAIVYQDINYSGVSLSIKENTDLVKNKDNKKSILNDAISSFKIKKAACFYDDDYFSGEAFCISAGEAIDLYIDHNGINQNYPIINYMNDEIKSIKIPFGFQVRVYEDDHFNGIGFTLTDDIFLSDLKHLKMDDKITSVRVDEQKDFICDRDCVVKDITELPIENAYGVYWLDKRIESKEALVSFVLNDENDYSINFFDGNAVRVTNRELYFTHDGRLSVYYMLDDDSDRISFLTRFNGGYFEMQFVESKEKKIVHSSPLFGSLFNYGGEKAKFVITNINLKIPLVIDKIVLTGEQGDSRYRRSPVGVASCWALPILSIYNYVVQGKCNQADRFINDAKVFFNNQKDNILQILGTSKPLPKVTSDKVKHDKISATDQAPEPEPKGILTHIHTDMNDKSLTVPATALSCHVSMKNQLLPHLRYRRDLPDGCIEWTLDILTDFTLLFGDSTESWNAENFGRIIERIIHHGDTGHAVVDRVTEERLIENVVAHVRENSVTPEAINLFNLKTAFEFSQLSYAAYLSHNEPELSTQSPVAVQSLPLGRYELPLANFHFVETIPRIREGGQWVEHPEWYFDIQVISGSTEDTLVERQRIMPVMDTWRQIYLQAKQRSSAVTDLPLEIDEPAPDHANSEQILSASRLVSEVVQSWLRSSHDNYTYVIVRLSGQIISITMAVDINVFDVGIAGSLTNPTYVLYPQSEGAVRGAGTAAIRALAAHYSKKGRRSLVSSVISQPSAIVKKKVGFRFIEDL